MNLQSLQIYEKAVLCPIFMGTPDCMAFHNIDEMEAAGLTYEHFQDPTYREAWKIILNLKKDNKLTAENICFSICNSEMFGQTNGDRMFWWSEVMRIASIPMTMLEYARNLIDFKNRELALEIAALMANKTNTTDSAEEILTEWESSMAKIRANGFEKVDQKEAACKELNDAIDSRLRGEKTRGMSSGVTVWDNKFGGLLPSHFYVLSARPGCGKTALSESIILNLIKRDDPVLYIQREMSPYRALGRLAAKHADVVWSNFEKDQMTEFDSKKLKESVNYLLKSKIHIENVANCNGSIVRALIARHSRINRIKLVVFDYVQLVDTPKGVDERTAIGELSKSLRLSANDTGIPVIAITQLNRESEKGDRKPRLSDLKSCGALEQDADAVISLWMSEDRDQATRWPVNWSILKNRDGSLGDITMMFDGPTMTFLGEKTII